MKLFISKYKETLEELHFGEYTYKDIYEMRNNNTIIFDNEYRIINCDNCFIVHRIKDDEFCLFFNMPKKVNYSNIEKSQDLIFSTLQIDEFMRENKIQELEFQIEEIGNDTVYYTKQKNYLNYIKGDEFEFKAITLTKENLEINLDLSSKDKLYPLDLSQYFYDYFEYNNRDNEKDFIYYETPERTELMKRLRDFYFSKFNYFKFCGPISGGKSTTLLRFKKEYEGVIYFNLKVIKKYYLSGNPLYKSIILYELERVKSKDKKETKKKLEEILQKYEVIETIFIKVIEQLISLNLRNILVIDQFKSIDFDYSTLNQIQKKIFKTFVGLIISSSIDEKETKNELELTLRKFNKMPKMITLQNQNYFFYVPNLLKNKIIKEQYDLQNKISKDLIDLYEQFSFKTKYISILGSKENVDKGMEKIENIISKSMLKHCLFPETVSLEFILLLINDSVEINMEYNEENINLLRKIPLKFIDIDFGDKSFSLHYGFPYIRTLVENTKTNLDIKKYFEQKMYEKQFFSNFKGIYFEGTVNTAITAGKISFNRNKEVKLFKIIVNNILEMKENDKENNAYSIINKIKNINKVNLFSKKDYKDYINERITKIQTELNKINNEDINFNINFIQAIEEELKILQEEKKKLDGGNKTSKKYGEQIIPIYNDEFREGNILIEQTQTNGRCLDSAFLFGDKNKKTLVCLQMKFYEKRTTVSSEDKNKLTKSHIKSVCRKVLSNVYLNLGIEIENWHYILILHYEHKAKSFNTNFVKICVENDLEYIFFDPIENKFYNKEQKIIKFFDLNFLTNLDDEDYESNPIRCFQDTEIINSYLKKRNRDLTDKISPKDNAQKIAKEFEEKYEVSFSEFFSRIKEKYDYIKNIKIISTLKMELNKYFPILNNGYGYIFLNNEQDGLFFEGKMENSENYITLNGKNMNIITPLKMSSFINIEEEFIFFIVKLS